MTNYIGKICPFCKTEIKEGESVTVCRLCNIPHHESCWQENGGCTTFGCTEKSTAPKSKAAISFCTKCGNSLNEGDAFCPKCGTPKPMANSTFCNQCGAPMNGGQQFCSKCGHRAGLAIDTSSSAAINQFNANVVKENEKKKKKPLKGLIIFFIILALIIGGVSLIKLFPSVDNLCKQGEYKEAYKQAEGTEKDWVLGENVVAYTSKITLSNSNDIKDLKIRRAYYYPFIHSSSNELGGYVVIYGNITTDDGKTYNKYLAYTWSPEDKKWNYWGTCFDYEENDSDDLEITLIKIVVKAGIEKGGELKEEQIDNINNLIDNTKIHDVQLIDYYLIDTSRFPKG